MAPLQSCPVLSQKGQDSLAKINREGLREYLLELRKSSSKKRSSLEGQSLGYGSTNPKEVLLSWIVDDGV